MKTGNKIRDVERGNKGFTMIEILLVLVVVGILAAVVIPRVGKGGELYNNFLAYTTAHKVAADLRLTRRLAITTGNDHRLEFDVVAGEKVYSLSENDGGWSTISEVKTIASDVTVSGDSSVTFSLTGAASSAASIGFTAGTASYTDSVVAYTGKVELS
ncbi:MAG: prepilin-type N-terminal cleavage/methylation domain-containing protein [Candidatus Omnitrophica bacterium]|nr:prepilin-type N-terminal cleavage/methylation domain-containing protein [Candidatus Omnitrophota bacterium]